MPNWCSNTIVVSAVDISKFKEWLGDGKSLLSKIAPTPQPLIDTVAGWIGDVEAQNKLDAQRQSNIKEFGAANWYDWNIANWGTKWDVDAEIDEFNTSDIDIILSFDSAWAPPTKAIQKLCELFPDISVRHSYLEEGVGFVGVLTIKDGVVCDIYHDDSSTEAWKQMASEEFGWKPWEENEEEETV
jgi:hypothetical protein